MTSPFQFKLISKQAVPILEWLVTEYVPLLYYRVRNNKFLMLLLELIIWFNCRADLSAFFNLDISTLNQKDKKDKISAPFSRVLRR